MEIYQNGSDIIKFRRELSGNTMKAVLEPSEMESEYLKAPSQKHPECLATYPGTMSQPK